MPDIEHIPVAADMPAPPLSAAVRVGSLLFVSGKPGYRDGGQLDDDFDQQFDRAVENLEAILARAGGSLRSIVKTNVLLVRAEDVAAMNARYERAFGPAPFPARTTCVVAALPDPKMWLEIECIAHVEQP